MKDLQLLPRYEFGPFVMDCGTLELWRGDEVVPLTPKAFDTLRVLITHRDRVVEKDELMKLVWPDRFVGEDTLTQNIATLRRALGDVSDQPRYIATVPRRGYRFIAAVSLASVKTTDPVQPDGPVLTPSARWSRRSVALAAASFVTAILAMFLWPHPSQPFLTRFVVPAPDGTAFSRSASFLAASPDGRRIAFLAARPGDETRIWVRTLDSLAARELSGTEGALSPFWSPDSQTVGFFANGALKTIDLLGEPPRILGKVNPDTPSATWGRDGVILFSEGDSISRVSSTGGQTIRVTSVDRDRGETQHLLPQFLPDGRHFLYVARGTAGTLDSWIVLGSLDGSEDRPLIRASSQAIYAEPGYLLFVSDGVLRAQPFDAKRLELRGEPMPVAGAEDIGVNPSTPRAMFSVSQAGTLAYRRSAANDLGWFDRTGRLLGWVGAAGRDSDPALSPDGRRAIVSRYDPATLTRNIWILDLERNGLASPLTSHLAWANCPLWSSDGKDVIFASRVAGRTRLYEKRADGVAETRELPQSMNGCPLNWSAGGDLIYGKEHTSGVWSGPAISFVSAVDRPEPKPLDGPWPARPRAAISPDGRWIAYSSDVSGRHEIYVRSFPTDSVEPTQISSSGGIEPQWRADGRELFFIAADKGLMAVPVSTEGTFRAETPRRLFQTDVDTDGLGISGRNQYAAAASGERFLINEPRPEAESPAVTVLLNWTSALQQ